MCFKMAENSELLMPIADSMTLSQEEISILMAKKVVIYTTKLDKTKILNKTWEGLNLTQITQAIIEETKPAFARNREANKCNKSKRRSADTLRFKVELYNALAKKGKNTSLPLLKVLVHNLDIKHNVTNQIDTTEVPIASTEIKEEEPSTSMIILKIEPSGTTETHEELKVSSGVHVDKPTGSMVLKEVIKNEMVIDISDSDTDNDMPINKLTNNNTTDTFSCNEKSYPALELKNFAEKHLRELSKGSLVNKLLLKLVSLKTDKEETYHFDTRSHQQIGNTLTVYYCCYYVMKENIESLNLELTIDIQNFIKSRHECEIGSCICCHSKQFTATNSEKNSAVSLNNKTAPNKVTLEDENIETKLTAYKINKVNPDYRHEKMLVPISEYKIIFRYKDVLFEQSKIYAEVFFVSGKGEIYNRVKYFAPNHNIMLTSTDATISSICCWHYKNILQSKLKIQKNSLKLMETIHLCIKNCVCCCNTDNVRNNNRPLKESEPRKLINFEESIDFHKSNKSQKPTPQHQPIKVVDPNLANQSTACKEMSSSKGPSVRKEIIKFINLHIDYLKNIVFAVNDNGKLVAIFCGESEMLVNTQQLQKIVSNATFKVNELGLTPESFCAIVNAGIKRHKAITQCSQLQAKKQTIHTNSFNAMYQMQDEAERNISILNVFSLQPEKPNDNKKKRIKNKRKLGRIAILQRNHKRAKLPVAPINEVNKEVNRVETAPLLTNLMLRAKNKLHDPPVATTPRMAQNPILIINPNIRTGISNTDLISCVNTTPNVQAGASQIHVLYSLPTNSQAPSAENNQVSPVISPPPLVPIMYSSPPGLDNPRPITELPPFPQYLKKQIIFSDDEDESESIIGL